MGGFATDTTITTIEVELPDGQVVLVEGYDDGVGNGAEWTARVVSSTGPETTPAVVRRWETNVLVDGVDDEDDEDDESTCGHERCVAPATKAIIPDTDEDDGVYFACDEHTAEFANQFQTANVEPIAGWR